MLVKESSRSSGEGCNFMSKRPWLGARNWKTVMIPFVALYKINILLLGPVGVLNFRHA
jgi:hypothetical protein